MGDKAAVDDPAIIARIREELQRSLRDASLPPLAPRPDIRSDTSSEGLEEELSMLRAAADIYDVPTRTYRRLLGPVLALAQRLARKVLAPSLERQVSYNTANCRLVEALRRELDALKAEQQSLRQRCDLLASKSDPSRTQG